MEEVGGSEVCHWGCWETSALHGGPVVAGGIDVGVGVGVAGICVCVGGGVICAYQDEEKMEISLRCTKGMGRKLRSRTRAKAQGARQYQI